MQTDANTGIFQGHGNATLAVTWANDRTDGKYGYYPYYRRRSRGRTIKKPHVKKPRPIDTFHVGNDFWWGDYETRDEKLEVDVKVNIEPVTVEIEEDEPLYEVVEVDGRKVRRNVRCENCNARVTRKQHRAGSPCPYCGN